MLQWTQTLFLEAIMLYHGIYNIFIEQQISVLRFKTLQKSLTF